MFRIEVVGGSHFHGGGEQQHAEDGENANDVDRHLCSATCEVWNFESTA